MTCRRGAKSNFALPGESIVAEMTSLIETCLPTKHNMADEDCDCPNNADEKEAQISKNKLKGPEKDLQTIFKKLRVDSGP